MCISQSSSAHNVIVEKNNVISIVYRYNILGNSDEYFQLFDFLVKHNFSCFIVHQKKAFSHR
jgi:hypothetical protein